ncbi:acid protease [Rickenella mellea]|uniref:Acid protease n=1 Tax=Rickenella mellea TaxID=50990 RepID=A0A4Y7Q252_9AGAM|nr:acid protease [Rickenella mellea]
MLWLSISLVSCLVARSTAISLPFKARPRTLPHANKSSKDVSNPFNFSHVNDFRIGDVYEVSLTAGGAEFDVQLDTGSSDLWLDTRIMKPSGTQDTGLTSKITYVDLTSAEGPVLIANVTFGNVTVPSAFISAAGSNATLNGDAGVIGVGPPTLSRIARTLKNTTFNGKTPLENASTREFPQIFAANPDEPKFFTFQLSRSETTGTTSGGIFTIGEVNSTLSGISNAPKLNVVSPNRWTVLMDGMIVNGKTVTGNSRFNISGQGPTQTVANFDTGGTQSLVPQFYADAIYSNVPGAEFDSSQGVYIVPCNTKIDVSFLFSGIAYPVHPIDTVQAQLDPTTGMAVCFGGFLVATGLPQDFVLGDVFLRDVYALHDFGSFISGTTPPFVQLLSTLNAATADSEFDTLSAQRNASITGEVPSSGGGGGGSKAATSESSAPRNMFLSTMLLAAIDIGLGMTLI